MQQLGKTYRELLSATIFGTEEADKLKAYFKDSFDLEDSQMDEFLDAQVSNGVYTTGTFFLLEDEDDIEQMTLDIGCANLWTSPEDGNIGFDSAMYLNASETVAILLLCTRDDGGDVYVVPPDLFETVPSIHEHIFKVNSEGCQ